MLWPRIDLTDWLICRTVNHFATKFNPYEKIVFLHSRSRSQQKFKIHWMFVSPTFTVPSVSLLSNYVCWLLLLLTKQICIYILTPVELWLRVSLCTHRGGGGGGGFCCTRWQTLFILVKPENIFLQVFLFVTAVVVIGWWWWGCCFCKVGGGDLFGFH